MPMPNRLSELNMLPKEPKKDEFASIGDQIIKTAENYYHRELRLITHSFFKANPVVPEVIAEIIKDYIAK